MTRFIIFTDLDGTLLHPRAFSFEAARPALALAAERGVLVVFCSRKTRPEIEELRVRCGNTDPFVFENGGGIVVPEAAVAFHGHGISSGEDEVIARGRPYRELRAALVELRAQLGIHVQGIGDLSPEKVGVPPVFRQHRPRSYCGATSTNRCFSRRASVASGSFSTQSKAGGCDGRREAASTACTGRTTRVRPSAFSQSSSPPTLGNPPASVLGTA